MSGFGIPDSILIFTPVLLTDNGPIPGGAERRVLSHTKFTFDPGGEANYIMAASELPIDIVVGSAKPKLDIECSDGREISDLLEAMGGIGCDISVSLTFARVGLTPRALLFEPALWKTGGGIDLDMTKGWAANKIEIMMTNVLQSANNRPFKSIYKRFGGRA